MKFKVILGLLLFGLSVGCFSSKKTMYDFPSNMAEPIKIEFTKQCDKGKILYEINCAKCHNVKVKNKTVIPDFKPEQLIGYELRVLNPKHESDIPETNVSAEELGLIMTFLSYKKKTGISVK